MIRVLQSVNIMNRAGLETMLMNYYRHIDRDIIQFDFLTHRQQEGSYEEEIRRMNGKVYHAPRLYPINYFKYFSYMKNFFKQHPEYKIIHSHIDAMSFFPLKAAKLNGIPVRIAHSHSSKLDKDLKLLIKYIALKQISNVSNNNCACSKVAGKFMFPKSEFKIIRNAIDLDAFAFDEKKRNLKKLELGLEGKFVVGHVGRYCYIKNQIFLLDVFKNILIQRPNSHLLLIGKGEDQEKLEKKIKCLKIEDNVSMLIDRADIAEIYQVMDVFVMPSLFEGLPVVGIEAQANGLFCLVSDKISKELLITSSIKMLNLNVGAKKWATEILSINTDRNKKARQELVDAGYDIVCQAKKLQQWYLELSNRNG